MTDGAAELPIDLPSPPRRSRAWWFALLLLPLAVWAANLFLVGLPVRNELGGDTRNSGYRLAAHYRFYLDPTALVLDLRSVEQAAPLDLFRGLFQAAKALHAAGRSFKKVNLVRSGTPVFVMSGQAFDEMGTEYAGGQNPIYLIRTLPEKLYLPDGTAAFGSWTGGWLGVMGRQMEDVNEFAQRWMAGGQK